MNALMPVLFVVALMAILPMESEGSQSLETPAPLSAAR